jgi:hypothetical protein
MAKVELSAGESAGAMAPLPSTPKVELHPAEKHETHRNHDPQRNGRQTCPLEQMYNSQQQEAQTDTQVPPSPVSRLKSAHPTIFNQRRPHFAKRPFYWIARKTEPLCEP